MDKEQMAIARLQEAARMSERYYHAPLIVTTSGGKDSSVCVALAQRAGIDFEVMHNLTTADAPETVRFVRAEFKRLEEAGIKCTISYPYYKGVRTSMWALIPQKLMPPTRIARYCCEVLKENGGDGRYIVTGVRYAESVKRAKTRGIYEAITANKADKIILTNDNDDKRRLFEHCVRRRKHVCNPIVDWTDHNVWEYIRAEHIPVNPLYECGYSRVGCIGCPMARLAARTRDFARYPKYKLMYLRAFDKMLEERKRRGKPDGEWRMGKTAEDVMHWWLEDGVLEGQTDLFGGGRRYDKLGALRAKRRGIVAPVIRRNRRRAKSERMFREAGFPARRRLVRMADKRAGRIAACADVPRDAAKRDGGTVQRPNRY